MSYRRIAHKSHGGQTHDAVPLGDLQGKKYGHFQKRVAACEKSGHKFITLQDGDKFCPDCGYVQIKLTAPKEGSVKTVEELWKKYPIRPLPSMHPKKDSLYKLADSLKSTLEKFKPNGLPKKTSA